MLYATATQFKERYTTRLSDEELNNHYLPHASARLEAMLAPWTSIPLGQNNLTASDLTIDLAYLLILQRSKDEKAIQPLQQDIHQRIEAISQGRQAMVLENGELLWTQSHQQQVWSSTSNQKPIFANKDSDNRHQ